MMTSIMVIFLLKYTSCSLAMMFRIGLICFSSILFHAPAIHRSFHWRWYFLWPQKVCFFILESISYFVLNSIIKYFQFQWTNISINSHLSCAVSIAFFACKQATCFAFNIIIKNWVWPLEIEPVMVEANPVETWFLTWRHDGGYASIYSVCWKCNQGCICESALESDILDLSPFKSLGTHLVR